MNAKNFVDSYGIKEIPNIFLCDRNGKVLYYTDKVIETKFIQQDNSDLWEAECTIACGNPETWFEISHNQNIESIYFRTHKRSFITGIDEPFIIAIEYPKFHNFKFCLEAEEYPFNFPITFTFAIGNMRFVKDEDAPDIIKTINTNGDITINFIDPAHSMRQLTLQEMKEMKARFKGEHK